MRAELLTLVMVLGIIVIIEMAAIAKNFMDAKKVKHVSYGKSVGMSAQRLSDVNSIKRFYEEKKSRIKATTSNTAIRETLLEVTENEKRELVSRLYK